MPTSPPPQGRVRPAEQVNADIRALVVAAGGWLYGDTRERYEALVEEWAAAVRAEMVEAA
jgi:hypothetical protein